MLQIESMFSFSSQKTEQFKAKTVRKCVTRGKETFDLFTTWELIFSLFSYNEKENQLSFYFACFVRSKPPQIHNVSLVLMFRHYLNIYRESYLLLLEVAREEVGYRMKLWYNQRSWKMMKSACMLCGRWE